MRIILPLVFAALAALLLVSWPAGEPVAAQSASDGERALFPVCGGGRRVTCVVDGDTIWYRGAKIRIADIDTPEVNRPACQREAALGRRATERLRELLNAGAFTLEPPPSGRTRDRFGRELRVIKRGGQSLGQVLVSEGLASRWGGQKRRWC
ncbi:MAG: thermonuclease family protein [Erythrobacter sp.]|jgi:endonuclease YncB( thermonuclease family)|nr:thermonuclease family protein [Erythrobacter sp.]